MAKTTKERTPAQIAHTEKMKKAAADKKAQMAKTNVDTSVPANLAKPNEEKKISKPSSKKIKFEKAYELLKQGKAVQVAGKVGSLQMQDGIVKHFADNGDYLGNVTLADLQEEKEWEEK